MSKLRNNDERMHFMNDVILVIMTNLDTFMN